VGFGSATLAFLADLWVALEMLRPNPAELMTTGGGEHLCE
jgi:hypothetical protein